MNRLRFVKSTVTGVLLLVSPLSFAQTAFEQFLQQQDKAYSQYRIALFQSSKGDQAAAQKAAESFDQQWKAVADKFRDMPPEVFASDKLWQQTLEQVTRHADESVKQIKAGQLTEAHETLESVRDELGQLRQRNHIELFSDHVNSYHEVMEVLLEMTTDAGLAESALPQVREKLGALSYLLDQMQRSAPVEYRQNNKYKELENGVLTSVTNLRTALDQASVADVTKAINALKPAYAKFFVAFG